MAMLLVMVLMQETPADLVKRLGSESVDERDKATRALVTMGLKALPDVEKAATSTDPEVAARALAIAAEIRRRDRARTAWVPELEGIRYTFRVTDAAGAVSDSTFVSRLDGRRVTLEAFGFVFFEKKPAKEQDLFWIVPDALKAGATWEEPYDGG